VFHYSLSAGHRLAGTLLGGLSAGSVSCLPWFFHNFPLELLAVVLTITNNAIAFGFVLFLTLFLCIHIKLHTTFSYCGIIWALTFALVSYNHFMEILPVWTAFYRRVTLVIVGGTASFLQSFLVIFSGPQGLLALYSLTFSSGHMSPE
jgi:hypothetical protein